MENETTLIVKAKRGREVELHDTIMDYQWDLNMSSHDLVVSLLVDEWRNAKMEAITFSSRGQLPPVESHNAQIRVSWFRHL